MNHTTWTYTVDSINELANQVKEVLLNELDRQGYLRVPASKINEEIAVVIHRPGWFGSLIKRWFGNDDNYKVSIIKMLSIADPEKKKSNVLKFIKEDDNENKP